MALLSIALLEARLIVKREGASKKEWIQLLS